MSHLRPIDPETGKTKSYEQYTPDERLSAITQIEDASKVRPASQDTAALANRLRKGTPREDATLDVRTAPAPTNSSK
jgi:hypothetical protein